MLVIEVLNSYHGDKKVESATDTLKEREKAAEVLNKMLRAGTSIFLERADRTFRVTGYDPHTDRLLIVPPGRIPRAALPPAPDVVVDAEVIGSAPEAEAAAEPEDEELDAEPEKPAASSRRPRRHIPASYGGAKGRVRAVAPISGG